MTNKHALTIVATSIALLMQLLVRAQESPIYLQTRQATNGLSLGVSVVKFGQGTNTTEQTIDLNFRSPPNSTCTLYIPKELYLARLDLYNSSNQPVAKTILGKEFGRDFDKLHWDLELSSQPHGRPEMRSFDDKWKWVHSLPKASDLFAISTPGKYRLEIEVQVMLLYLREKQVRQVVRFSPLEITLYHP